MSMTLPTIHMNGTSEEALLGQLTDVSGHLRAALDAMSQATPNGRDYYPQGPSALAAAMTAHLDRRDRMNALKNEIDALALAIAEGGAA